MMTERDILLKKLSSVAFAMFEIRLFLDTHPDSTDAMAKFDDLNDKYVKLKEKFEHIDFITSNVEEDPYSFY